LAILLLLAESEGFEPSIRCRIHTFQACSFSHSDSSPVNCLCTLNLFSDSSASTRRARYSGLRPRPFRGRRQRRRSLGDPRVSHSDSSPVNCLSTLNLFSDSGASTRRARYSGLRPRPFGAVATGDVLSEILESATRTALQ
jgi:hypothetical protein